MTQINLDQEMLLSSKMTAAQEASVLRPNHAVTRIRAVLRTSVLDGSQSPRHGLAR